MAKKQEVRRFRLRKGVGTHFEPNPDFDPELPDSEDNPREIAYEPGSVVKSVRQLDKIFANKFRPYDGMKDEDIDYDMDDQLAADRENEAALEETQKAAKKSERVRDLVKEDPRVMREKGHGDDTEDGPQNIPGAHKSPQEAERVARVGSVKSTGRAESGAEEGQIEDEVNEEDTKSKKSKAKAGDEEEDEDLEEEEVEEEEESEDLTRDFDKAKAAGVQVFKRGDKYFVHEKGEDSPMTGSKKGFTKKSEVKSFIAKQGGE